MKLRAILSAIAFSFLIGGVALLAQDDCGNGLPCGPVPWPFPNWPALESPTPVIIDVDESGLENTPTPTPTPTTIPTLTPVPTSTPLVTAQYLEDAISTAAADLEVTAEVYFDGTLVPDAITDIGSDTTFFSYAKGLTLNTFGIFTPIANLFLLFFASTLFFSIVKFGVWGVRILVQFVIRVINLIFKFIPFFG